MSVYDGVLWVGTDLPRCPSKHPGYGLPCDFVAGHTEMHSYWDGNYCTTRWTSDYCPCGKRGEGTTHGGSSCTSSAVVERKLRP